MTEHMRNDGKKSIAVIGGGASGLMAAISARDYSRQNAIDLSVTVFEAASRVGKKILSSGNGRCNLSNENIDVSAYLGDTALINTVFQNFGPAETLSFFHRHGMLTHTDEAGRVYPRSNQATTVLDLLRNECDKNSVRISVDTPVRSIKKMNGQFSVNGTDLFDAVIIACGSPAGVGGTDTLGDLIRGLKIGTKPFLQALCPLIVQDFPKSLKGVRAHGKISLYADGRPIASDCGEIQYTEQGLSGIPVMQVSAYAARAIRNHKSVLAVVDSLPEYDERSMNSFFLAQKKTDPDKTAALFLGGLLHKRLAEQFLRDVHISTDLKLCDLPSDLAGKLFFEMKHKKYTVKKTADFRVSQAASGGVSADQLNAASLESRSVRKLFFCGEAVDVVGPCGGYNLQWAWSSGFTAGVSAVKRLIADDQDQ